LQLAQSAIHVQRRPEHHHVDDQAQRAKLILHAFPIRLAELTFPTVKDGAGQLVAALVTSQMPANVAPMVLIIEERSCERRFRNGSGT
jgi:hypothetical protein